MACGTGVMNSASRTIHYASGQEGALGLSAVAFASGTINPPQDPIPPYIFNRFCRASRQV